MDTPTGPSATLGAACERLSLRHDGRPDRGVSMPLDLNDAPLRLERRVIATAAPEPPAERPRSRYVSWIAAQQMVMGRGLEVLRLAGVSWPPPRGDKTNCPFPDHPDHNPSWRFSEECGRWFCSCGSGDVFDALVKLRRAPDFEAAKLLAAEMLNRRDAITEPREGVTLNTFAAHKGLPIDSLRDCGLSDGHHRGGPAVRIRYRAEDGTELDPRWRIALTGDLKTVSPKGATTALYGLDRRDEVLERGFVLAVEGETDALTAWHRGWPAIGLPGASNFRDDRDAAWFDGIEKIIMVREPDQGGGVMTKRLAGSRIASRVRVIELPGCKDVSALHLANPDGFDAVLQAAIEAATPLETAAAKEAASHPLNIVFYADLALDTEDNALVDGLMERRGFTAIIGEPGSGKTFFALHLALSLARGVPFFGRAVQQTPTLYIATESGAGIAKRALAYEGVPRDVPFAVITTGINLKEPNSQNAFALVDAINEVERSTGIRFGLIIIDTLSRAMPGADESGSVDMSNLIGNCDTIRGSTGTGLILVHHVGKDASRGSRGSSLLPAAIDTEITLSAHSATGMFIARASKQRELPCDGVMTWRLEVVELGQTGSGKPITTCVVVPIEGADALAAPKPKLSPADKIAFDQLVNAINESGTPGQPPHVPSSLKVVPIDLWRNYVYTASEGDKEAKKKAFQRARDRLQAKEIIGLWNDNVWITEQ
jgi:RecA/RadA recombinase